MARKFPLFAKRFFLFLNALAVIVYLLSAFAPYANPSDYWFISLMGLGFPFIFLIQLLFIIFWLIVKPKFAILSLIALIIGWKSISVFFAFHSSKQFNYNKPKNTLRVVHWNVARFIEMTRNNNKGSQTRLKMLSALEEQNADVLCLSEFYTSTDSVYYNNIHYIQSKLHYPYFYYSWDSDGGKQWDGEVIFSRYPIINSGKLNYPRPTMPEALIYVDIIFNLDTVRFYTTHLQSVRFKKTDYESIEKIKNRED